MQIKTLTLFYVIFLTAFNAAQGQLQSAPTTKIEKIDIKADRFLFYGDSILYVKNDTTIFLPDSVDFLIRKNTLQKTEQFYKTVQTKMTKTKVSSFVYDLIFTNPSGGSDPKAQELSELRFIPFRNDSIGTIRYKHLEVFGTRINDTSFYKPSKYTKVLNSLHLNSQPWVIKKNLRFKAGQTIDPQELNESERLIRRLPFIKDARIFVNQPDSGNVAEIKVLTKDVFPYNVEISPGNENNAQFGISHINIGGFGHKLEYDFVEVGQYEFFYTVPNILGSFIDSELDYAEHFRKAGIGGQLRKDFVTQEIRLGGGLELSDFKFGEFDYDPLSDSSSEFYYNRQRRDIWIGRSFKSEFRNSWLGFANETFAIASARIDYQNYYDRPIVAVDTNYQYHDRTNLLVGIGLSSREYFKDKFILNYGRTEDIPTGTALSFVAGLQHREFDDRVFLGFNYSRGGYLHGFGYLNSIYTLSSFVNQDGFIDGVARIGLDYFSRLVLFNRFKFRQFISLTMAQAINPSEDIYIRNQNDLGIRGVSSFYLKATNKINLRVEPLLFTPLVFLGFRTAAFGFLDMTATGNSVNNYFNTDFFWGYGCGLRFRNDNLAISTIQLRFGIYPNLPLNARNDIIDVSTSSQLKIRDFDFKAPEITLFE